jgi:hypothetical protein
MGQRHQQFIRTLNPVKHGYHPEGFDMFNKRKKFVILPFHNQWLFGRSAPLSALRVLEHAQNIPEGSRNGKDEFSRHNSPFGSSSRMLDEFNQYINAVECIINYTPKSEYGVNLPGFGSSWFLNRTDREEYEEMSSDFTAGDNNDGITIIDIPNLKYCFMNISNYSEEEISEDVNDLPYLKPVSALDYMSAYYPMGLGKFSEYSVKENTKEELIKQINANTELNNKIASRFEPFEVLTLSEVQKMFPKVYMGEAVK